MGKIKGADLKRFIFRDSFQGSLRSTLKAAITKKNFCDPITDIAREVANHSSPSSRETFV